MLSRADKEAQVGSLRDEFTRATAVFVAEFSGVTVQEIEELRGKLHEAGPEEYSYKVSKNSVLRRATEGLDAEAIADKFVGPTAIALSYGDPVSLAKMLTDFSKAKAGFNVKAGMLEGKALSEAEVATLASLPSLDELRGMLVGLIQAPATKIARLLQEPGAQIARVLDAKSRE